MASSTLTIRIDEDLEQGGDLPEIGRFSSTWVLSAGGKVCALENRAPLTWSYRLHTACGLSRRERITTYRRLPLMKTT